MSTRRGPSIASLAQYSKAPHWLRSYFKTLGDSSRGKFAFYPLWSLWGRLKIYLTGKALFSLTFVLIKPLPNSNGTNDITSAQTSQPHRGHRNNWSIPPTIPVVKRLLMNQSMMKTNPLMVEEDVLRHLVEYVGDDFLFFAGIARRWRCAWGRRPPLTRAITAYTSPTQLLTSFDSGLERQWLVCQTVVQLSRLELLQWTGKGTRCSRWSSLACCTAARAGHLDTLVFARGNNVPWGAETCCWAALGGHLHVLQWARAQGCPWDSRTCEWAARGGHLAVLKWCRSNGCRWNARTCAAAALGGHLEVLQWCSANGCPWDEGTCANAIVHGHLPVVAWARDNGCPWNRRARSIAKRHRQWHILQWAQENGF